MKTEDQIRQYMADLKTVDGPCQHDHDHPGDALDCLYGWISLKGTRMALAWVLGEWPELDQVVAQLHAVAKAKREKMSG